MTIDVIGREHILSLARMNMVKEEGVVRMIAGTTIAVHEPIGDLEFKANHEFWEIIIAKLRARGFKEVRAIKYYAYRAPEPLRKKQPNLIASLLRKLMRSAPANKPDGESAAMQQRTYLEAKWVDIPGTSEPGATAFTTTRGVVQPGYILEMTL